MAGVIRVQATLCGQRIDTTVDSELTRYYLEQYLQGARENPDLDEQIDRVHAAVGGAVPTREYLRELSQRFSTDFATAVLANRLLRDERSRAFRELFERELVAVRTGGAAALLTHAAEAYRFLFVPGWVYQSVLD